jgi:hypothetical protein
MGLLQGRALDKVNGYSTTFTFDRKRGGKRGTPQPAQRVRVILPELGPFGELFDSHPMTGRAAVRIDGQVVVMDGCRLAYF